MKKITLFLVFSFALSLAQERLLRLKVYYCDPDQVRELLSSPNLNVVRNSSDGYLDVIVGEEYLEEIVKTALKYEITIADIAKHHAEMLGSAKGGVFGNYYLYSEIRSAGIALQNRFPGLAKFDSLATRSIENRALYLIKISNSPNSNNGRPEILISGALHAYEPIGPSLCMSDMTYLCEQYASDPEVKWLVDNRQVYFVPVMNPDGYVYNETYTSRMWRKNRRNNGGSYGVDLNRNYPYKWGYDNIGSSASPSAWNYRGTARLPSLRQGLLSTLSMRTAFAHGIIITRLMMFCSYLLVT